MTFCNLCPSEIEEKMSNLSATFATAQKTLEEERLKQERLNKLEEEYKETDKHALLFISHKLYCS